MKYLIAVDLEGAHDVTGEPYSGLNPGMAEYEKAVKSVTEEVNVSVDTLFDCGASEVSVWDNHGNLDNLDFSLVDKRAKKVIPQNNSTLRLEFLREGFNAMVLIGYHAKEGAINGVLAHTYDSSAIQYFRIDGKDVGEYDIDGMIAASFGVPVIFLSSDDVCVRDFSVNFPHAFTAITKIGKGRNSAEPIEKRTVLNGIRTALKEAAKNVPVCKSSGFPCAVEIRYTRTEFAAEKLRKINAAGVRTVYGNDAHVIIGTAKDAYELRKYL